MGTTRAQRRRALARIRGREAVATSEMAQVRAVAGGLVSQGGLAMTYLALTLTCISQSLGTSPSWVLARVAASANLIVAVVLAEGWRRARRFLGAHLDVDVRAPR